MSKVGKAQWIVCPCDFNLVTRTVSTWPRGDRFSLRHACAWEWTFLLGSFPPPASSFAQASHEHFMLTNSAFCDFEVTMVYIFLGHTSHSHQSWYFRNESPNCTSAFPPQHNTFSCSFTTNKSSYICHEQFHFCCYMNLSKCKTNSQAVTKATCPFSMN